jgi:MYXO-CTERM domain-containing protein
MSLTRSTWGFVALLLVTTGASAQEIYVDSVAGNDDNPGSEDLPKQTLASVSGFGAQYDVLYLKAGGTYETSGLRVTNAAVTSYGSGAKPIVLGTAEGYGVVSAAGGAVVDGIKVMGTEVVGGTAINVSGSGNEVLYCEIDATGSSIMMGFGIMGTGNWIHHNDVRNLGISVSGDQMGTSGGAEAYMVMGSDNEISYNSASDCWSDNPTLGGAEGGCLEIVNGEGGSTISGVSFHHNYCEFSVGLFEGCSGDFSGGDLIQLNHGVIRDSYVAYNVAVDAMWLYLLQPVNTDFINLVFEHNTIVHTELNDAIPQGAANAFTLSVEQETVDGATYGPTPLEPGDITVRNNAFVVLGGSGMFNGVLPEGDHYNNLFAGVNFPNNWTQHATEIVVGSAEAGIGADGRPAAGSAVIDAGSAEFVVVDRVDFDGNAVPLGSAPDIGAFEYCDGADCQEVTGGTSATGGASASGGADEAGGTPSTGGATGTTGGVGAATGGTPSTGGANGSTTGGAGAATGGTPSTGGASGTTEGAGVATGGAPSGTGGDGSTSTVPVTPPPAAERAGDAADEPGCACSAPGTGRAPREGFVGLLLVLGGFRRWRRQAALRSC